MAEQEVDWSKLPEDVREKLAELDLELSEEFKDQQKIRVLNFNSEDMPDIDEQEIADAVSSENIPKLDMELVDIEIVEDQEILIAKPTDYEYISEVGVILDNADPEYYPESDTGNG
ncbi:hypothetical protein FQA39_LY05753 [Lamprigera yunnana]|nr:hypothetical protein FQA39_LY05753 [Lamprigera yunnana]